MTNEERQILDSYHFVSVLDESHGVSLVQQEKTKKLFLKKVMTNYHYGVVDWLKQKPVRNMPLIHEMIEDNGTLTVIEDFYPGSTLQELLDNGTTFTSAGIRDVCEQLCDILAELHSAAPVIIHRGVSPQNILITPDGSVKLLEVNTARWYLGKPEQDESLIGKTDYAAPEQYTYGESSILSDIYAVGMVIKRMLNEIASPKDPDRQFVENVAWKCTQVDPNYRYQSAEAVAATLRAGKDIELNNPAKSRRFLPPGYRKNNPLSTMLFTAMYIILFNVTLTLNIPTTGPGTLWLARILTLLFSLIIIFFTADYLGCQEAIRINRIPNKTVRILAITAMDLVLAGIFTLILTRLIVH